MINSLTKSFTRSLFSDQICIKVAEQPKSIFSTFISLLVHSTIVIILWSAPSIEVNPPEVPPPESIDATLLPPPPESKATESRASTPSNQFPSKPSTTLTETALKSDDSGLSPNSSGNANAATSLSKGNPINVAAPSRGFDVKYELTGKFKGIDAAGSAKLAIRVNGDRYSADLVASSTGAKFSTHSGGVWRKDTIATDNFSELMDLPWPFNKSDKQSSFKVDYAGKKVNFVNRGQAFERELTVDPLYDYLAAIAYLQAGFQSHAIRAGHGRITLPIGKRQEIGTASISIGSVVSDVQTYDGNFEGIHASIRIDSASIKSIDVWFVPEVNYEPRKMHIEFDKGEITLLGRNGAN